MKETIAEMLKVEAQAKKIVAEAEDLSAEIVRKARTEASSIQEQAHRDAQAKAAMLIQQGIEQARRKRDEMLAQIDADNQHLCDVAPDKAEAAKKIILAALTGS